MENQWAVFFRDGKAYDIFGPGRHTISSANIPLLTGALQTLRIIGDIFDLIIDVFSGTNYTIPDTKQVIMTLEGQSTAIFMKNSVNRNYSCFWLLQVLHRLG